MRKTLFIVLGLALLVIDTYAQQLTTKDSLLKQISLSKEDSNKVKLLLKLANEYRSNSADSAIKFSREAAALSKKTGYAPGMIKAAAGVAYGFLKKSNYDSSLVYYAQADSLCVALDHEELLQDIFSGYSWLLNNESRFDESLDLCERTLAVALRANNKRDAAYAYTGIGLVYVNRSFFQQALENYFKALENFRGINDTAAICGIYDRISGCYYPLKMYEKSLDYEEKAIDCLIPLKDTTKIRNAYFNAGLTLKELAQYPKARSFYQKAMQLNAGPDADKILECRLKFSMTALLNAQGDHAAAVTYAQAGVDLSRQLNFESGIAMNLAELGRAYMHLRKFSEAKKILTESISISQKNNLGEELLLALDIARFAEAASGNFPASVEYDKLYRKLNDSVFNQQIANNVQELESKYLTAEKQNEISRLQGQKKIQELSLQRKNIFNGILLGSVVVIIIISLLSYRYYKQKQKMQQQRISELETQQQLTATENVLKGEEQERTRLAKDLHDGLGGMLSGIKYSLHTMKGDMIMTAANAQAFERSIDMLDSSINEMRRVAHNIMPEALVKFGLDTALKDFCNDINNSGALQLSYQSIGLDNKTIEQTTAITIYRIVQELINNTIKHAAAKTAIVQVSCAADQLTITVEDDGKGFDANILNQIKARQDDQEGRGMGWSNIRNRVDFLKGTLDVRSEKEKGTSVHIELGI